MAGGPGGRFLSMWLLADGKCSPAVASESSEKQMVVVSSFHLIPLWADSLGEPIRAETPLKCFASVFISDVTHPLFIIQAEARTKRRHPRNDPLTPLHHHTRPSDEPSIGTSTYLGSPYIRPARLWFLRQRLSCVSPLRSGVKLFTVRALWLTLFSVSLAGTSSFSSSFLLSSPTHSDVHCRRLLVMCSFWLMSGNSVHVRNTTRVT